MGVFALLLAPLLAVTAATPAPGTDERWPGRAEPGFQHLTNDQGLPNEVAYAFAEDADGYLWVGTAAGLARWDGYRFRAFRYTPGVAGTLPDNLVQALHADRRGRLWVGTSAGGLARYEPATQTFVATGAGQNGLSHVSVRAIADDGHDGLWVGTDGGLDHLDGASGRVVRVPLGIAHAHGRRDERIIALLLDRQGRLWAGTPRGLLRRDVGATRFEAVSLPHSAATPDREPQPEALAEDGQGRIWVGTNRGGAYVVEPDGSARAVLETRPLPGGPPLSALRVGAIAEARPGEVWIATLGHGIVVVDSASGRTHWLRHRPGVAASLIDNAVRGLHRDRSGLLWVATHAGLSRVDPRAGNVLTIAGVRGERQARSEYGALFTHSDGRVWLGTNDDGVQIVQPQGGSPQALRPDAARPEQALPPDVVASMAEGPDGSVYIATFRGLFKASADGRRVRRVSWPGRDPGAGTGPLVRDGDTLWVAGLTDGLWRLHLPSGQVRAVLSDPTHQLTDRRVMAMARGPGGELWIGTRNGLNRFDPASGQLQRLPAGRPEDGALAAGLVSSLLVDRAARLWVGTYGGGVHRLLAGNGSTPAWQRIGTGQGLPDENVNALVEDAEGRIWASTENGLAVIDPALDPQMGRARALRRAEGVVFLSYWTNAATRTPAGELLFGASGGLTLVRPAALQPWAYQPPVVATEIRVGGRPAVQPADGTPLVVPADANQLSVEYAALDFSAPERNRYEHRLEGYETEWQAGDAQQRRAAYANLPPGDYRLQLRGSNRDGVFNPATLELPLRVLPAWHQTWWFRAAATAAALLAVFGLVQMRTRVLRARRRELQHLVDARTAELQAVTRALEVKSRVLERASIIDPLTGLHNRRFLGEHIEAALAASLRRTQSAAARPGSAHDGDTLFFLIDADHFKRVNDEHGHAAGDAVLVQLGLRLQAAMRESDFVVRWGGEEFLAVARDTDRARADELAERIRASVADQPFLLDNGQPLHVSCSLGHAAWPFVADHPQAVDWHGVVNLADLGLLAAKRLGRNAWVGLHATAAARPEGLVARAQAAPAALLEGGEIAVSSSRPPERVAEVLASG